MENLLLIVFFVLIQSIFCIYEDQIGKFDWKREFIGSAKFVEFDPVSNAKRLIVATEDNVLSSLVFRNGKILWRKIFDNSNRGIISYMHVNDEILTIIGSRPYIVRIWGLSDGFLQHEWPLDCYQYTNANETFDSYWSFFERKLLHVIVVFERQLIVNFYNYQTGSTIDDSVTISVDWLHKTNRYLLLNEFFISFNPKTQSVIVLNILTQKQDVLKINAKQNCNDLKPISHKNSIYFYLHCCDNEKVIFSIDKLTNRISQVLEVNSNGNLIADSSTDFILMLTQNDKSIKISQLDLNNFKESEKGLIEIGRSSMSDVENLEIVASKCFKNRIGNLVCNVVLKSRDFTLIFVQNPDKIIATREESLSRVSFTTFVDLPVAANLAAVEFEFDENERNFLAMLTRRLKTQINQLSFLIRQPALFRSNNEKNEIKLTKDNFGLRKLIVIVTETGKLFGIDNLNGQIVWKTLLSGIKPFEINGKKQYLLYVQRTVKHYPHKPQAVLLGKHADSNSGVLYSFDALTGQPLDDGLINLSYKIKQAFLLNQLTENHFNPLVIIDENDQVHSYPNDAESLVLKLKNQLYYCVGDTELNTITGYTLSYLSSETYKSVPKWKLSFRNNEQIIEIAIKNPQEKVRSQGRILADRSVLYKYINPNLIAIVTIETDPVHKSVLNVYLVDSVSGLIVYSISHKRVLKPVEIVHSENWLVYSYFNEKFRRTEITSLELYEGTSVSNRTVFSSLKPQLVSVIKQSYILPAMILKMKETFTLKGITNKNILISLSNGGIVSMPWLLLDPRRPTTPTSSFNEEIVIPYKPELPILTDSFINYNQSIYRVKDIVVSPSDLESTCLVLVNGLDLFYTRIAPSKEFDVLKDDFNYVLMSTLLFGLVASSILLKKLSSIKLLRDTWRCE